MTWCAWLPADVFRAKVIAIRKGVDESLRGQLTG
jgi:hypothetical protein